MQVKSDPINDSTGLTQYLHPKKATHPMDYPVPDFGVDHDVKSTLAHAAGAEESLDTKWKSTKWDDLPKFEEFKLV